ncbi:hypothetical protein AK812_SmicGene13279 [Symbiodinium microadriaticum]|uniref:Uncharacterized protein n=1 Tax=Symbiodinium microadriaticum TaxID=2951 RepID=A0A1Q9E8J5_SYMMI|nr:hypothetical protein AK812_SmicGene13279 [Symbiodinium microadriaticum]
MKFPVGRSAPGGTVVKMVPFLHLLAVAAPVFLIASLAMPAGVGGGLLYVPLLIVTHVAGPRLAAVLAQPIIVGAALAGNVFNICWQLRHKECRLLDGQLALAMIAPCLAGNLVGTIMNQLFPSVVIMILLLLLVSCTFSTSARRALNMWHAENESRCALQASRVPVPAADASRSKRRNGSGPELQEPQQTAVVHPRLRAAVVQDMIGAPAVAAAALLDGLVEGYLTGVDRGFISESDVEAALASMKHRFLALSLILALDPELEKTKLLETVRRLTHKERVQNRMERRRERADFSEPTGTLPRPQQIMGKLRYMAEGHVLYAAGAAQHVIGDYLATCIHFAELYLIC